MAWRIAWVEAEDFMAFRDVRWELSACPGLTLILGDRGPGRSNGSGKSALFEAVTYALYGRTVRKLPAGGERRRSGPGQRAKSCTVRAQVEFDDGTSLIIVRGRDASGPHCRVTGLSGDALASGVQAHLDARLGDYGLFTSTAMFTGDVASFCRRSDAEKKELLEQILGIHGYDAAAELAKARADAAAAEVAACDVALGTLSGRIQVLQERREALAVESFQEVLRRYAEVKAARAAVDAAKAEADAAAAALAKWHVESAAAEAAAEAARAAAEAEQAAAQAEMDAAQAEVSDLQAKLSVARSREKELRNQLSEVESGTHPPVCPTCGQRWPQESDPEEVAKAVARLEGALLTLRASAEPMQAQLREAEARLSAARKRRGAAVAAASAASAAVGWGGYKTLLAEAAEAEADLAAAFARHQAAREAVPEETVEDEELAAVEGQIEAAFREVEDAKARKGVHEGVLARSAFWRKGFGRSGLPSYLLDAAIPGMNEVAASVAADLTDGELCIRFDPAAVKGSKNVLGVEVDYAAGGDAFDAASKGERARIDVATLFALRDVAAKAGASGCSQLFLDEVMDGVDPHFSQAFIRMLRKRYSGHQIFLISHDPTVASLVDGSVTVVKRGDTAILK